MNKHFYFKNIPNVSLDKLINDKIIELGRGNIISKIDIRQNPGRFPIYSSSANNEGKMGQYSKYMFDEELIAWSVDGGGNFFYKNRHKFSVTNVCGYIKVDKKKIDLKFLHAILVYQHQYLNFDYQFKAHPSVIRKLYKIPLLPIMEQKKIASILNFVDEVIEKTQSQINKLQDLKKSVINDLLTKGITYTEFKNSKLGKIAKSYEIKKLKNVLIKIKTGPFGSSITKSMYTKSGYKVYGQEQVIKQNIDYGNYFISEKKYNELISCSIQENDLLISLVGTVGKVLIIPKNYKKGIINPRLILLRTKNIILPDYLKICLESQIVLFQLQNLKQGGTMGVLNSSIIKQLFIVLPSIDEQKKILLIIKSIGNYLKFINKKLIKLKLLKKSLMQDLLTGKVRVLIN